MKAIKRINTNFVICIDDDGRQLIAYGKGLGFNNVPFDIVDLKSIDKTYYCSDNKSFEAVKGKNDDILIAASDILVYIKRRIKNLITDNLYFVLVDHIGFTIDRAKKGLYLTNSLLNEIEIKYPEEYEVSRWAVDYLRNKFNVKLLDDEIGFIAFHIVENELADDRSDINSTTVNIYDELSKIIEEEMGIAIDKSSYNYARFKSHIDYLLLRSKKNKIESSSNDVLFNQVIKEFNKSYSCALKIGDYLSSILACKFSNEELLYLILHINRLCSREVEENKMV